MRARFSLVLCFVLAAFFTATAFAGAAAAASPDDPAMSEMLKAVLDALRGHQYPFAASLALVFAVALTRRYGAKKWPALAGDMGGAVLTLLGAFGGAMAAALGSGSALSGSLAWTATGIAVSAAGGYTLIKKLIVDPMLASAWYRTKAPEWLKAVLGVALWVFTKPDVGAQATAAGDAAVKAKPSTGADGTVGKPDEF